MNVCSYVKMILSCRLFIWGRTVLGAFARIGSRGAAAQGQALHGPDSHGTALRGLGSREPASREGGSHEGGPREMARVKRL